MTKTSLLFTLLFSLTTYSYSQIGLGDTMVNSADRLILSDSRITLGGYGEIDFNNTGRNVCVSQMYSDTLAGRVLL